jgi:EAL domain-containing protein (putative c-di-GMP-specific phosphodiesterase class I)
MDLAGARIQVRASVGMAAPMPEDGADELLRNADVAMQTAKGHNKGAAWFEPRMRAAVVDRLQLEADLRRALEHEEFRLVYQPIIDLQGDAVAGMEALVRWQHPTRGLVPPGEFIGTAEATGLIAPLGRWVLFEACRRAAGWQQAARGPVSVSVNVSAVQLRTGPRFIEEVVDALRASGLPAACLQLEVTESAMLRDSADTAEVLRGLRALGVRLALDDFGTGYSCLSYLEQLPFDVLKVDKSFVARLVRNGVAPSPLAEVIVNIGEALGLRVVAEGVEVPAQAARLRALGCAYGQGYYYARPLAVSDVIPFLARWDSGATAAAA